MKTELEQANERILQLEEQVKKLSSNMLGDDLPLEKCTRLEVINNRSEDKIGRVYVNWKEDNKIEGQLQDEGRTLKVFISKR